MRVLPLDFPDDDHARDRDDDRQGSARSPATSRAPDPEAWLRLVGAGGALAPRRALLAAHDGDPGAALRAGAREWRRFGLDATQRRLLARPDARALAHGVQWLSGSRRHVLGWGDADYPALLAQSVRPPLALFVEGDPMLAWCPMVAVVGTRNPTPGGRDHAAAFSRAFAAAGLGVASGLAAGIDTAAHVAALDAGGATVAVLGTGPDIAYPRRNAALLGWIAAEGLVVSEFPPGTRAQTGHFPSRNRIIAGLALGTLVVEAAWRSGSLITARLAADSGREVMALPGSIANPLARGCHRLIRDGALLVETPREVVDQLAPAAAALADALRGRLAARPEPAAGTHTPAYGASAAVMPPRHPDHETLWKALGHDPTDMDALVSRTRLTAAELSSMLLAMELEGRVANDHGRWSRVATRKAS
jgi:DNA processing protein